MLWEHGRSQGLPKILWVPPLSQERIKLRTSNHKISVCWIQWIRWIFPLPLDVERLRGFQLQGAFVPLPHLPEALPLDPAGGSAPKTPVISSRSRARHASVLDTLNLKIGPARGSKLALLKSTFNVENFICRLSWSMSSDSTQFTVEMCGSHKSRRKSLKTPIFIVQGRSGSSMLVPPDSSSAVLVMIRSKSVSICNRFHSRWANSGKVTISKGGILSFEGNLLTHLHQITA